MFEFIDDVKKSFFEEKFYGRQVSCSKVSPLFILIYILYFYSYFTIVVEWIYWSINLYTRKIYHWKLRKVIAEKQMLLIFKSKGFSRANRRADNFFKYYFLWGITRFPFR